MNLCFYCKFFEQPVPEHVWYFALCKANRRKRQRDPVFGEWKFVSKNDLGETIYLDQEYEYCKDINIDGRCNLYSSKEENQHKSKNASVLDNEGNWDECTDDFQETLDGINKALGKSWKL